MTTNRETPGIICFGEMLWDLLPDKALPGGAPMNVAYHLQQLQEKITMVSRIGNDERGYALLDIVSGYGLRTEGIQTDDRHETGKVYANVNNRKEVTYDIVYPVAWDFIAWESTLAQLLSTARYLVFGSLASRNEVSRQTLEKALEADIIKVLDINLRAPHYTQGHIAWLLTHADILKLNETELRLISNWYDGFEDNEAAMRALSTRFNIPVVVVTLGEAGAILYREERFYYQPGLPVVVADTIGSGDAFLAGLLHSFIQQRPDQESLAFANALGALVASRSGGCPAYEVSEITAWLTL
ncbi:carbohydrate kinase family protein [Chitinophaga nivalis]|uniref:Carbohydrate kinase n=1 Tax=Chitinophaga nivalis TaxID=2991709 RepID=A0ABT3IH20_9BACT|nr:carbohydrate kinase [Chitinophaga nivalis]MCW3467208.1 carbohydrate kinase [Chitinophaga nivalis]MCW3483100.1 carbohydrate kinase [Chitinophaga nivalis]